MTAILGLIFGFGSVSQNSDQNPEYVLVDENFLFVNLFFFLQTLKKLLGSKPRKNCATCHPLLVKIYHNKSGF